MLDRPRRAPRVVVDPLGLRLRLHGLRQRRSERFAEPVVVVQVLTGDQPAQPHLLLGQRVEPLVQMVLAIEHRAQRPAFEPVEARFHQAHQVVKAGRHQKRSGQYTKKAAERVHQAVTPTRSRMAASVLAA